MLKQSFVLVFLIGFTVGCNSGGRLETRILQGNNGEVDVIVFSSTDCPIANALAPEIERIHQDVKSRGGELFLVHVWEGRTNTDATLHAKAYGLTMEILIDDAHELVDLFNATTTPEAVVISYDDDGKAFVVYQGLINNLFDSPGNKRDEATQHFVWDAIDAAFDGGSVSPSYRTPTGCIIEQMQ
jgi:hypothetical protein